MGQLLVDVGAADCVAIDLCTGYLDVFVVEIFFPSWRRVKICLYIKRTWTEVHVRIIPQGDSSWLCADKSAGMRVSEE